MQKSFIVENVEVDLSNLTEKVKEEIEFNKKNSVFNSMQETILLFKN